jgi:hypothetical protein
MVRSGSSVENRWFEFSSINPTIPINTSGLLNHFMYKQTLDHVNESETAELKHLQLLIWFNAIKCNENNITM